jgi:tetratricopeptide (TPR) repeat protein
VKASQSVTTKGNSRWLVLLVAAITILAFIPAMRAGFVTWDDDKNFLNNPDFRGLGPAQLRWMWSTFHLGHYVPLSWMTLGLDYLLWGMNPAGYHLTSVLIHAANSMLVYLIARRLIPSAASPWAAVAAALLFSLHPLRVESVVWVTERRDVLSGFFFFSGVLAYLRYAQSSRFRWYALTLACYLAALLSKATSITLPAVLLVLNIWPLARIGGAAGWWDARTKRVALELAPMAALGLAAAALTFTALQSMQQLPVTGKLAVSAYSLGFYLMKTILPIGLSPLYAMPTQVVPTEPQYVAALVVSLAITAIAFTYRTRHPAGLAAWIAFIAIELPMLGIHQNGPQIAADRYTYHAAPVLALLIAGAVATRWRGADKALSIFAIVAFVPLSVKQTGVWHDSRALWSRALAVDSVSAIAQNNWASLLLQDGRVEEAGMHFERALAISPTYPQALNGLGIALTRTGRIPEAVRQFEASVRADSMYDEPHNNWGVALVRQGDVDAAIVRYQKSIALNANNPESRVNLGNAFVRQRRFDEAIAEYREALRIQPGYSEAHHNWGVALAQQERFAEAVTHFEEALRSNPEHAQARTYLEMARARAAGAARP